MNFGGISELSSKRRSQVQIMATCRAVHSSPQPHLSQYERGGSKTLHSVDRHSCGGHLRRKLSTACCSSWQRRVASASSFSSRQQWGRVVGRAKCMLLPSSWTNSAVTCGVVDNVIVGWLWCIHISHTHAILTRSIGICDDMWRRRDARFAPLY